VGIEYTLTLEDGTQVDSNVGGETLRFEQGRVQQLRVHKVEGDQATPDFNHPLAGKTPIFDVEILEVG
jgi:FKBP-type peptidyl-prolyl cis-trans isomerase 2